VTVADRLRAAGISQERIEWWFAQEPGSVWLNGEPVTDPATPADPPARVLFRG
jgi:hypothetical protein